MGSFLSNLITPPPGSGNTGGGFLALLGKRRAVLLRVVAATCYGAACVYGVWKHLQKEQAVGVEK